MKGRTLVNGQADGKIDPLDRGLAYGDGLFETIRFRLLRAPLWPRHMQRLADGCRRLGLPEPVSDILQAECAAAADGLVDAVVRICLTRGIGPRGYAPPATAAMSRIVSAEPMAPTKMLAFGEGIAVRTCALRLGSQPALAGLKHLNRLEQVLARAELDTAQCDEGLLFDGRGHLISATAANIFLVRDGSLITPALNECGVAGVARAEVLAHCVPGPGQNAGSGTCVRVGEVTREDLMQADEVFLTNSVRGVMPVRQIDGRERAVGEHGRRWRRHWDELFGESSQ